MNIYFLAKISNIFLSKTPSNFRRETAKLQQEVCWILLPHFSLLLIHFRGTNRKVQIFYIWKKKKKYHKASSRFAWLKYSDYEAYHHASHQITQKSAFHDAKKCGDRIKSQNIHAKIFKIKKKHGYTPKISWHMLHNVMWLVTLTNLAIRTISVAQDPLISQKY